tara:strand:- start:2863 stop:3759 length:897 start_codon:yes stop_codon:yes gene_type:complete
MDKVLTRKLFKDRYFKYHKPKQFNNGGIANIQKFSNGGLTSQEKAIYAATLAAPLLSSTQRPGENVLSGVGRALGEGLGKLPATMISLAELQAKKKDKGIRSATSAEKKELGYNEKDRLIVKVEDGVVTDIKDKPTFGEREKAGKRYTTISAANDILTDIAKGASSGPLEGRYAKASAALGFNAQAANFNTKLETFRKEAIAALRGAQVGPLEEASFNAILPSILDPENVIVEKIKVAKNKIEQLDDRLGAGGTVVDPNSLDYYNSAFEKFGISAEDITYDTTLDYYSFNEDGKLVKD